MSAIMKLKVLSMNVVNESQIKAFEKARQTRDARFDGKFFVAVRTTGIYCRPICRVRMPKVENITLYVSAAAATGRPDPSMGNEKSVTHLPLCV